MANHGYTMAFVLCFMISHDGPGTAWRGHVWPLSTPRKTLRMEPLAASDPCGRSWNPSMVVRTSSLLHLNLFQEFTAFKMFKCLNLSHARHSSSINTYQMYIVSYIQGDNIWLEISECVKKTLLAIGPKMQVPASYLEFLQLWHALANLPNNFLIFFPFCRAL